MEKLQEVQAARAAAIGNGVSEQPAQAPAVVNGVSEHSARDHQQKAAPATSHQSRVIHEKPADDKASSTTHSGTNGIAAPTDTAPLPSQHDHSSNGQEVNGVNGSGASIDHAVNGNNHASESSDRNGADTFFAPETISKQPFAFPTADEVAHLPEPSPGPPTPAIRLNTPTLTGSANGSKLEQSGASPLAYIDEGAAEGKANGV